MPTVRPRGPLRRKEGGVNEPFTSPTGIPMPADIVPSRCRSCDAPIYWAETANHKLCPYNIARDEEGNPSVGTSHFATCPDANRWTRKRTKP